MHQVRSWCTSIASVAALLLITVGSPIASATAPNNPNGKVAPKGKTMINQLRVYRVTPAQEDRFLQRFRDHAVPIMTKRYGFRIVAMWTARDKGELRFVYLLSWPDEATMKAAWTGFMADQEWSAVKARYRQEGGEMVEAIEQDRTLSAVPFSAPIGG